VAFEVARFVVVIAAEEAIESWTSVEKTISMAFFDAMSRCSDSQSRAIASGRRKISDGGALWKTSLCD
jgi:hypothetical protein